MLHLSSDSDFEIVFPVINLWLNNYEVSDVNIIINELRQTIPTYKLIPLTYQIFSRLGSSNNNNDVRAPVLTDFQDVLRRLVVRLCAEHPHHTLPLLFALSHEGV